MPVVEYNGKTIGVHLGERALVEQATAHIGFISFVVRIEVHRITDTEVRQEVFSLVGHVECDDVVAAIGITLLLIGDGQVGIDGSDFFFLDQR